MFLFLDVETGGLDPKQESLLTISADLVPTIGSEPIHSYNTRIAHTPYRVSARALEINRINLVQHDKVAIPAALVAQEFRAWLALSCPNIKPQPVGWNIPFDLGFVHDQLISKYDWEKIVDYHSLDVCALVEFLIIQGKLPPKTRRLVHVAQHFGLDTTQAHDAAVDNRLCRLVLEKLINL